MSYCYHAEVDYFPTTACPTMFCANNSEQIYNVLLYKYTVLVSVIGNVTAAVISSFGNWQNEQKIKHDFWRGCDFF